MEEPQLLEAFYRMQLVSSFDVAAASMFLWDYLLTFDMELQLVWLSRWNFVKVLYLVQRYMPFVDTVWLRVLHHHLGIRLSTTYCHVLADFSGGMFIVGFAASELLLTLRTWAVWNRSRRLAFVLPILYIGCWGCGFWFSYLFLSSLEFGEINHPGFIGCFITAANGILTGCWIVLIVWDALTLVLMIIPGVEAYRSRKHTRLYEVVYRDGVLYYVCLFGLSCVNIILIKTLPATYINLLSSLERCLHSMLSSRVLLHIRAQANAAKGPHWADGLSQFELLDIQRTDAGCVEGVHRRDEIRDVGP
ncbi:hypothetical protein B0H34DRAFT_262319 [Crassisporium funariophilum]|nr:hypothetical protein B0H34DRAFT_262319 [Crassisporium funariophilum]